MSFWQFIILLVLSQNIISCMFPSDNKEEPIEKVIPRLELINLTDSSQVTISKQNINFFTFVNNDKQILVREKNKFSLYNLDGSLEKDFSTNTPHTSYFSTSNNNSKIVFVASDNEFKIQYICLINYDGSNTRTFAHSNNSLLRYPSFSNNNKFIVYSDITDSIQHIKTINLTTASIKTIYSLKADSLKYSISLSKPFFSYDDNKIFFNLNYCSKKDSSCYAKLCAIGIEDTNLVSIIDNTKYLQDFCSSRVENKIYFINRYYPKALSIDYNGENMTTLSRVDDLYRFQTTKDNHTVLVGYYKYFDNGVYIKDLFTNDKIEYRNDMFLSSKDKFEKVAAPRVSTDCTKILFSVKEKIEVYAN